MIKFLLWEDPSGFYVDNRMKGVRPETQKGQTKPVAVGHCCYYLLKW